MKTEHPDPKRIWLLEDDRPLTCEIVAAFAAHGHTVSLLTSAAQLACVASEPTVLIVDRMIGGEDSLTAIEALRRGGCRTPVMVISSKASVDERIIGLRAGGDDYLVKPFEFAELVARVERLIARMLDTRETVLRCGSLTMDLIDRTVKRDNDAISLLPREFVLLEYFLRRKNQTITRSMLLEGVWNFKAPIDTNVVDAQISNLRRKIDRHGEPRLIKNRRGIGYIMSED